MIRHFTIDTFIILVFVTSILSVTIRAQDERAKVAEAYEQSGDYRSAARLWQELYTATPSNDIFFNGVVRTLKSLNNYSSLVDIIKERVARKKNTKLLALYGQVLYKSGKEKEAQQAWAEALSQQPITIETFKEVASTQIEIRLVDYTINTLTTARTTFNNETIFADDLSQLYASKGDYKNGIREVLKSFELSANLQSTQGRLSAYMVSDTAIQFIAEQMKKSANDNEDNYGFQKLYEWFLRETKQYDKAFEVVKRVDKLTKSNGRELLAFADQARMEGQHEAALKAYSVVMSSGKKNELSQFAYYGYARTLEARTENSLLNSDQLSELLQRYHELVSEFPGTNIAAESQLRIARITASQLRNTSQAIDEYSKVIKEYSSFPSSGDAVIELGNTYLMNDDIQRATVMYRQAEREYSRRFPNLLDRALYMLGELYFFQAKFDSAKVLYDVLSNKSESEFANDAIERGTIIGVNQEDTTLLTLYSQAALKAFQRKYDDAFLLYKKLYSQKLNPDLAEASYYKAGEMLFNKKDYVRCREVFTQLTIANPETIYGDRVLFFLGASFAAESNKTEAIKYYQELLMKFPRSILLQETRERIRKLRGDA